MDILTNKKAIMKKLSLICLLLITSITTTFAQDLKLPALSPTSEIMQSFATSDIKIAYSRPSMRGRKVFGNLVPYGDLWRTGANAATKVSFGEDVILNGTEVKKGEYALYTVPNEKEWEIVLNKGVNNWGTGGYKQEDDVIRFKVTPKRINNKIETFTITIGNITYTTCDIVLKWENTKVLIPVKVDNKEAITKSIKKAVETPNIPYYQAARYYYTTDQNLDDALSYMNKALEANPKAFWMWNLKAQIAQKLNNKDVAIESAKKAMELAQGSAYEAEYKKMGQEIIDSMK